VMLTAILSVILILFPFLIFNYPFGNIFLGDLGAYSLGLILSILTIITFGRHPEISPWGAVLILIYPVTEVFFSLSRRILSGAQIFRPDREHLHFKLFLFFRPQSSYKKIANALVMPSLSVLWLFPLIAIIWTYQNPFFILISIFLFLIFYSLLFIAFSYASKT
jgi:UDP-N-acetylmuramyl pentapeptide phosphotransferase/UDP-N-acetylglucosamine-1-phosphate transferase